ncbi:hypothetical protein ACNVED_03790 [Legionella sp. D16C41]|uniref:hypothetical protein n=1 Tax=Legionella sp. D16C41 TaxID=3402688 RepID=UPI003AF6321B
MAVLSEVIAEFEKAFQYLNNNKKRQSKWYEFWLAKSLKNAFRNPELTKKLEQIANECLILLNELATKFPNTPFEQNQKQFFTIIAQTFHLVQVQRFKHGEIESNNYQINNQYILERFITAKNPGLFEQQLTKALQIMAAKYPEHKKFFKDLVFKINKNTIEPYLFFQESRKFDVSGRINYSERINNREQTMLDLNDREEFAKKYINVLKM